MRDRVPADPFATLGLPAEAGLTDDDVRSAWRRIAATTHPDRADGGDPACFAAAAAAYTVLRTAFGRGEALADLAGAGLARPRPGKGLARGARSAFWPARGARSAFWPAWGQRRGSGPARGWERIRRGRPVRLLVRILLTASVSTAIAVLAGARPAAPALITGAVTWLVLSARRDLAPPS